MSKTYTIQQLKQEFDVSARTIRFYEDKGLLFPQRQGVTRLFSESDRVRLRLTLRGKRLGFSLQEISEIIDMYDPVAEGDNRQLVHLCMKISDHRRNLLSKIRDLEATLSYMDGIERRAFDAMLVIESRRETV